MSSVFSLFHQIVDEIEPLREVYLPDNDGVYLSRQKIDERTLSIQLYGAYNAGKSTLINVLLGMNAAVVGEIPTTDHVEEFNWTGYKLLDSPGVNAPIEHEKITLDRLKKSDLVVFVIRQDDQDVKDIYDRIFDCIAEKKHVFIVLNYNGLDPNAVGEGSVELLVNQINIILLAEAEKRHFESTLNENISVLAINLNSALRGRLEKKALLLESSGYNSFIIQFCEWVKSYDSEHHFVEAVKNYLKKTLINPIQEVLDTKRSVSSDLQHLSRAIRQLEIQKITITGNATSKLREIVLSKKKTLLITLSEIRDEIEFNLAIEKYVNDIELDFNNWFIQESEQMQEVIYSERIITNDAFFSENEEGSHVFNKISSMTVDLLKNENLVKDSIVGSLKLLRSNKIAFKGVWVKTFGKWAEKLGPVVTIIATVFEAYQSGKQEDKSNQQQKSKSMQLYQIIEAISNDLIHSFVSEIENIVGKVFDDPIQQYKDKLMQLNENATVVEKDHAELQLIAIRLEQICIY
ncbi:MAG: 50S ribosome-binding GTPase [Methylobacter sp.]|nr:50S ribosome-binding GTPase [Candidatus Methylobacter titanis]